MKDDDLKTLLDRVLTWPTERQEAAAELLLMLESEEETYEPSEEELVAIRQGLAQAKRGEFASEQEVAEVWRRFGKA